MVAPARNRAAPMAGIFAGRADPNPSQGFDRPAITGCFGKPRCVPFAGAWYRFKDTQQ